MRLSKNRKVGKTLSINRKSLKRQRKINGVGNEPQARQWFPQKALIKLYLVKSDIKLLEIEQIRDLRRRITWKMKNQLESRESHQSDKNSNI